MMSWKEFTSPDGRKYYYNKATKESRWTTPEEMKGKEAAGPAARRCCSHTAACTAVREIGSDYELH